MMIRWSLWLDKKTVATLISDRRAEGAPGSAGSFAKPSKTLGSEGKGSNWHCFDQRANGSSASCNYWPNWQVSSETQAGD